jgi:hypothetical protein
MASCQIGYAKLGSAEVDPCGKRAVTNCADCGSEICSGCRFWCCSYSFCEQCYDYHVAHTCLRKPAQNERHPLSTFRPAPNKTG